MHKFFYYRKLHSVKGSCFLPLSYTFWNWLQSFKIGTLCWTNEFTKKITISNADRVIQTGIFSSV